LFEWLRTIKCNKDSCPFYKSSPLACCCNIGTVSSALDTTPIRISLAKMIVKYIDATMIMKSFERVPLDSLDQSQVTKEEIDAFNATMDMMQDSMDEQDHQHRL